MQNSNITPNQPSSTANLDTLASNARNIASDVVDAARDRLGSLKDTVKDSVENVASRTADATSRAGERAGGSLTRASDVLAAFVRERPFVSLGAAFAVGYLAIRIMRR
jgi:ElaB/YqjD/DUF883 family membrane-anchored ribosome-binding protein